MKKIDTVHCNCEECSSGSYNQKDYFVTQEEMQSRNLKNGLSGVLRVKNEEFLDLSIKTSIDALDELIIVVQKVDHDPYNSFEVAKKFESLYPEKIKVYLYEPNVDSPTHYERSQLSVDKESIIRRELSVHSAANYYNFSFSKASYKYSLKIDADHFFFTDKLDFIRNFYKKNRIGMLKNYIKDISNIKILLSLHKSLIFNKNKLPSFFGINLYKIDRDIIAIKTIFSYAVEARSSLKKMVLGIFNGGGDYVINETKNELFDLNHVHLYEQRLNFKIEKFVPQGVIFFHLHGVKNNFSQRNSLVDGNPIEEINKNKHLTLNIKDQINLSANSISKDNPISNNNAEIAYYFNKIALATKTWDSEKHYRQKYLKEMLKELKGRIDIDA